MDPDVRAVLRQGDGIDAAYAYVGRRVEELLGQFEHFESDSATPLDRITALASLVGFPVQATPTMPSKNRAAMFVPTPTNGRGYIVYDASLPVTRVVFSIGHEIIHSFFPNSNAGVRFRSAVAPSSKPGRELEMLCEHGASLLVMPTKEFVKAVTRVGFGLESVNVVRRQFGTSFEATLYRMAHTADSPAAAVKFRYRHSKADLQVGPTSGQLFPEPADEIVRPRYRCQSFHCSASFRGRIPFNKSVSDDSCVYLAGCSGVIERNSESLPNAGGVLPGQWRIEALRAPFQADDADAEYPDVLALIRLL